MRGSLLLAAVDLIPSLALQAYFGRMAPDSAAAYEGLGSGAEGSPTHHPVDFSTTFSTPSTAGECVSAITAGLAHLVNAISSGCQWRH